MTGMNDNDGDEMIKGKPMSGVDSLPRRGKPLIKPSHKGRFTRKAKAAGAESVQGYASKVLAAPKGKFSPATRTQANFARNFGGRK